MSKFYFNANMVNDISAAMTAAEERLENNHKYLDSLAEILWVNEGFNIKNITDSLRNESAEIITVEKRLKEGEAVIREVSVITDTHSSSASSIVTKLAAVGAGVINDVVSATQNAQNNVPSDSTMRKDITFDNAQHGDVFTANGYTYEKFSHWGSEKLLRTDEAGGIGLFDKNGNLFEAYNQHYQKFYHGENPGVECTSTALAQSSTINGLYRNAHQYNDIYGNTQIGGYQASSEDITRFCVDNLKNGCSTVIYYNYTGHESNHINWGHAVTVVGANPNATTVHDLWVIDPATGQYVDFDHAYGGKSNSMFICYESNPGQFGGAGTRYEHIQEYFNK